MLTTSSFKTASQLSSKVSISNANRSFCSSVSFSTHLALSNLGATAAAGTDSGADLDASKMGAVGEVVEVVLFCELSKAAVGGEEEMVEEAVEAAAAAGFGVEGEEKKEVMEALAFGFFAVEVAMSAALRLRGVVILLIESNFWKEIRVPEFFSKKVLSGCSDVKPVASQERARTTLVSLTQLDFPTCRLPGLEPKHMLRRRGRERM